MKHNFSERAASEGTDEEESGKYAKFGRLQHYTVSKLFGQYNHRFSLDANEPTLLTGANGTGKSSILRSIHWISRGMLHQLMKIDFEIMRLEFEDATLTIKKASEWNLEVRLDRPERRPTFWLHSPDMDDSRSSEMDYMRLREEFGEDWDEMNPATRRRLFTRYTSLPEDQRPGWVRKLHRSFPALFISDQRLTPERRRRPKIRGEGDTIGTVAAIEAAVAHINDEVQRYKSLYGTASQNLDRDFPRRVFRAISSQREFGGAKKVLEEFQQVQAIRSSLADTGLIGPAEIEDSITDLPLNNADLVALIATYLDDTKKKLATFEPLRLRLEPFMDFLRRHYKGKEVWIDDEDGFKIQSTRTREDIRPVHLSSGEQQMFILAHKLLFESAPGTLVMIDEPELSLHVLWQSTFVDDLTEISAASGTYFLLATHSPTLIAGRTDLRRSLDG
ncbi:MULTISPECIES: AAA family ATPase [Streptomyces albidoflavus group]|uniref:AAA family ATPase n=1 Tax=Streptomyces albidoflavus TaxID=1886 RepID=A0ABY3GUH8_9ACTN|nr:MULTISPECIES: AAA family ATPase [Streptomyces albidoflavus group]TWV18751.1 AAA family ATPase [Streptomyces albidoflavus]